MFNVEFLARRAGFRLGLSTGTFSDRLRFHWGAIEESLFMADGLRIFVRLLVDIDRRNAWDGAERTRDGWMCEIGVVLVSARLQLEKTIRQHRRLHELFTAARLEIARARPSEPLVAKVAEFMESNYHSAEFAALSAPIMDLLMDTEFLKETLATEDENSIAARIGRNFSVITDWADHWSEAIDRIDHSIRKTDELRLEIERERVQAVMLQHYFPSSATEEADDTQAASDRPGKNESFGEIHKLSKWMSLPDGGKAMFPGEYGGDKRGSNAAGNRMRDLIEKKLISYRRIGHLYAFEASLVGQK